MTSPRDLLASVLTKRAAAPERGKGPIGRTLAAMDRGERLPNPGEPNKGLDGYGDSMTLANQMARNDTGVFRDVAAARGIEPDAFGPRVERSDGNPMRRRPFPGNMPRTQWFEGVKRLADAHGRADQGRDDRFMVERMAAGDLGAETRDATHEAMRRALNTETYDGGEPRPEGLGRPHPGFNAAPLGQKKEGAAYLQGHAAIRGLIEGASRAQFDKVASDHPAVRLHEAVKCDAAAAFEDGFLKRAAEAGLSYVDAMTMAEIARERLTNPAPSGTAAVSGS